MESKLLRESANRAEKGPDHEIEEADRSQIAHELGGRPGDRGVRWPLLTFGPGACAGARRLRLVVVEEAAEGVGPYLSPDAAEDTIVILQCSDEAPAELALRVVRRIASIEREGQGVARAVVLLGPQRDQQAMAARQLLAHTLLVHAQTVALAASELILAVGGQSDPVLRHQLMALVEALVGEPEARSMAIRIRFGASGAGDVAPAKAATLAA